VSRWNEISIQSRADIVARRELSDGRFEYLCHDKAMNAQYYTMEGRSIKEKASGEGGSSLAMAPYPTL